MADREYGFRTRAIHAGNIPDAATGARALPIYQSTAFVFDDTADAAARFALQKYGNIYSRLENPTVAAFEERIASLEVTPGSVDARTGDVVPFRATARDERGRVIEGLTPSWSFSPGHGVIGADGAFVGYDRGTYTVTATLGDRSAQALVSLV